MTEEEKEYESIKTYRIRPLTTQEYINIVKEVEKNHNIINCTANEEKGGAGMYKYVDATIDLRRSVYFTIRLRGLGDKVFSTTNRFDKPKFDNLYDEVMHFLKTGEE